MILKKKYIYAILFLFCAVISNAQKRVEFPHSIVLKDTNNNKYSSKLFYNFGKPVIIEFWATHCGPCINQLNSFKEVYKEWQQKYGVKIIVISIDPKVKRKRALKMIKENDWPFQFYFDPNKKLYNKIRYLNVVPQTIIFDKNFRIVKKIMGIKSNVGYKVNKDGSFGEEVRINPKGKYAHLDCDLTEYEDILIELTN